MPTFFLYHSIALVVRIIGIRQFAVVFELKLHILMPVLPFVSSAECTVGDEVVRKEEGGRGEAVEKQEKELQ